MVPTRGVTTRSQAEGHTPEPLEIQSEYSDEAPVQMEGVSSGVMCGLTPECVQYVKKANKEGVHNEVKARVAYVFCGLRTRH